MFDIFVKYWWQYLLVGICCYFVCNINFAILFSRLLKKDDVRQHGSGNPGTANMLRVFGLRMGVLTFVFDALKGAACCLISKLIFKAVGFEAEAIVTAGYVAGLFAVLGHVFPVFYRFHGGKGVATSIGVCFALQPMLSVCCILPCLLIVFATDRVSITSLALAVFMIVWSWVAWSVNKDWGIWYVNIDLFCCVLNTLTFALIIFAHRLNILRLVKGNENRAGLHKMFKKKSEKSDK